MKLEPALKDKKAKLVPKPGIIEENGVLIVRGDEYIARVASALASPTRLQILKYTLNKEADVGEIAELIKQSKANASAQIKKLEEAGLIKAIYKPGNRGVKKICSSRVREVRIYIE